MRQKSKVVRARSNAEIEDWLANPEKILEAVAKAQEVERSHKRRRGDGQTLATIEKRLATQRRNKKLRQRAALKAAWDRECERRSKRASWRPETPEQLARARAQMERARSFRWPKKPSASGIGDELQQHVEGVTR